MAGATRAPARGVTGMAVGSGDWFGLFIELPSLVAAL
jgi:hypothetical protein